MRLLLVLMLISSFAFAQSNEQKIAYQYYVNGDFDKAIAIYKDLSKTNFLVGYYTPYFNSLYKMERYTEAERLAYRMVKKFPNNLNYLMEKGICQRKNGQNRKSERTFEKVYNKLNGQQSQTINLANSFVRYEMYSQALDVYDKAQVINTRNNFSVKKAQIYHYMGYSEKMVEEYLNLLSRNPRQKPIVIANIQNFLDNNGIQSEANYQLVKKHLLRHVQQEKDRTDFTEMLIWLFMQNHQFKLALIQAKALDRRTQSNGERVYDLAEVFLDNEYYKLAIDAYDFLIKKGKRNYLFVDAHINKLYALSKQSIAKQQDITLIDARYQKVVEELGKNKQTVILLSNYAHFKAFYMHDLVAAQKILYEAMHIPQVATMDLAECKIEYADVMLLSDSVWEALLYYSRVEKEFKEHTIGHKAKYKRAKVAYYQGDFDWAQAQLDVLKASTSKLIANDAMDLSLLITDNLGLDTSEIPMQTFAKAELFAFQKKYKQAIATFDSLLIVFKGHTLTDEVYWRKYELYKFQNNVALQTEMLDKIIKEFAYDILADDAVFHLAQLNEQQKNKEKAMELYEQILLKYKGSIYTAESRKRYRLLRGDNLNQEE